MPSLATSRTACPSFQQHAKPRQRNSRQRISSDAGVSIRRACKEDTGAIRQSVQRER